MPWFLELRQLVKTLPCLENLAIDEQLPDYSFFEGLGQSVVSSYTTRPPPLEPEDDRDR